MTLKQRFKTSGLWKQIGFVIYGLVGFTALISLIWAIVKIAKDMFYSSMGFFGSIAFFILVLSGLNHGVKFIFGKDLFGN